MDDEIGRASSLIKSENSDKIKEGVALIQNLASQGNHTAIYAEATWSIFGVYGYDKNDLKAKELLERAATGGVPEAYYDLAVLALQNKEKNRFKIAFNLFLCSAILGDVESQNQVVESLKSGTGCFRDESAAENLAKIWHL